MALNGSQISHVINGSILSFDIDFSTGTIFWIDDNDGKVKLL